MQHDARRRPRRAIAAASTAERHERAPSRLARPRASWPIETQVSVATTSAPRPRPRRVVVTTSPSRRCSAAIRGARRDGRGVGQVALGRADRARACRPGRRRAGRSAPCCWRRRRGRRASARPSVPLGARATVCRSARIWHGWKLSVSALTTGPGVLRHLPRGGPGAKVRHTIAAHLAAQHAGGVRDRLAAADLGQLPVDHQRVAAELGDPGRERDLGARGRLVEDDRDGLRARPAAGRGERGRP